jgi:hypothetical protein
MFTGNKELVFYRRLKTPQEKSGRIRSGGSNFRKIQIWEKFHRMILEKITDRSSQSHGVSINKSSLLLDTLEVSFIEKNLFSPKNKKLREKNIFFFYWNYSGGIVLNRLDETCD